MIGAELGEDRDHYATDQVAAPGDRPRRRSRTEQLQRVGRAALVPRGERSGQARPSSPLPRLGTRARGARAAHRRGSRTWRGRRGARGPRRGRRGLIRRRPGATAARPWRGSCSSAARGGLVACVGELVGLGGEEGVQELLDLRRGMAPVNWPAMRPSRNAFTAGTPGPRKPGRASFASTSSFASSDGAAPRAYRFSRAGRAGDRGRTTRPRSRRSPEPRASARSRGPRTRLR